MLKWILECNYFFGISIECPVYMLTKLESYFEFDNSTSNLSEKPQQSFTQCLNCFTENEKELLFLLTLITYWDFDSSYCNIFEVISTLFAIPR